MNLDVLFINPGNHNAIYQDLAKDFSAIETPTWALLLAQSARSIGYKPAILDVNAERLSVPEAVKKVASVNTRLICFVVYGQNPNSGTVNMSGTIELANSLKKEKIDSPICAVGSHVSALPKEIFGKDSTFGVIDLYRVKPISEDLIKVLEKYNGLVTVEEQCLPGGFGSAILEAVADAGFQIPVKRLGLAERYYFENGGREYLLDRFGLSVNDIVQAVNKLSFGQV